MTDTDDDEVPEIVRAFSEFLHLSQGIDTALQEAEALQANRDVSGKQDIASLFEALFDVTGNPDLLRESIATSVEVLAAMMHERYQYGKAHGRIEMSMCVMQEWFDLVKQEYPSDSPKDDEQ